MHLASQNWWRVTIYCSHYGHTYTNSYNHLLYSLRSYKRMYNHVIKIGRLSWVKSSREEPTSASYEHGSPEMMMTTMITTTTMMITTTTTMITTTTTIMMMILRWLHCTRSASLVSVRHPSLSYTASLQLRIRIFMSLSASSLHLALGLPFSHSWC